MMPRPLRDPHPSTVDRWLIGAMSALIAYAAGCLIALAWSLRHAIEEAPDA